MDESAHSNNRRESIATQIDFPDIDEKIKPDETTITITRQVIERPVKPQPVVLRNSQEVFKLVEFDNDEKRPQFKLPTIKMKKTYSINTTFT